MKFPEILESWRYRDPGEIADGLIARTERQSKKAEQPKPERQRRDRHYTKSRSIHLRELVRIAKRGGLK